MRKFLLIFLSVQKRPCVLLFLYVQNAAKTSGRYLPSVTDYEAAADSIWDLRQAAPAPSSTCASSTCAKQHLRQAAPAPSSTCAKQHLRQAAPAPSSTCAKQHLPPSPQHLPQKSSSTPPQK
jgi:hypothetical protein